MGLIRARLGRSYRAHRQRPSRTQTLPVCRAPAGAGVERAAVRWHRLADGARSSLDGHHLLGGLGPDAHRCWTLSGATQDVTSVAGWTSSTSVATFSTTTKGLATGVRTGTTTITASWTGVSGKTTLTVTAAARTRYRYLFAGRGSRRGR